VVVYDETQIDSVKKDLEFFLFKKSFTEKSSDVKFRARTNKDELKQVNNIVGKMSLLLAGIGAIALIV